MTFTGRTSVNWCPLDNVINDESTKALNFDLPSKHPEIVGCCNGLVCISIEVFEEIIFIWNPSTLRWIRLPYSGCKASLFPAYGFGYDESSDDYKFVLIACNVDDDGNFDTRVMIYSLKSRNWKTIGDFPNGIPTRSPGEFSNGALYWIGTLDIGKSSSWTIISLDLATETYGEILQPVYDEDDYTLTVKALGEWLCLVCKYLRTRKTDVWLTKVHGVNASWDKLTFIQNLTDPQDQFHGPLIMVNDEKMLLHCGQKLVLYDVKNGSSSEMKNHDGVLAAWIVVESLVSLDAPEIADK